MRFTYIRKAWITATVIAGAQMSVAGGQNIASLGADALREGTQVGAQRIFLILLVIAVATLVFSLFSGRFGKERARKKRGSGKVK